MLNNYFFVSKDFAKKIIAFLIIMFFISFKYFFLCLVLIGGSLVLFRRRIIDPSLINAANSNVIISPCSGRVSSIEKNDQSAVLNLKIPALKTYGLTFPFSGEVENFYEEKKLKYDLKVFKIYERFSSVEFKNNEIGHMKLMMKPNIKAIKPRVWIRSGDFGNVGSYFGYLPFGGKIVIEFNQEFEVLVKEDDKVLCTQTLLSSKGSM